VDLPPFPRDLRYAPGDDAELVTGELTMLGVGDGHPVLPPTPARIDAMLGAWDDEQPLGVLAPLNRQVTVRDVAVCAVLAGCRPAALPVLVAAVGAVQRPEFNLLGITTTTGSAAIGIGLHGAVVDAVKANAGANYLGPGNVANATIGRALATVIRVVGGAVPGLIDVAIAGQPGKYGLCFAELPATPGWPNLHSERGVRDDPGAVTVAGVSGTVEVIDASSQDVADLADTLAASLVLPVSTSGRTLGSGEPVVLIPPEWVDRWREAGWTRQRVRDHLWDKAWAPLDRLAPGLACRADEAAVRAGLLRVAERPEDIAIVVAGGIGTKATLLPTWSGSRTVTVPVATRR
jgi:hypothetical protein